MKTHIDELGVDGMKTLTRAEAWEAVLTASSIEDFDLANQIMTIYGLNDERSTKRDEYEMPYVYYYESPTGETGKLSSLQRIADVSNMSLRSARQKFWLEGTNEVEWVRGPNAGWKLWRVRKTGG